MLRCIGQGRKIPKSGQQARNTSEKPSYENRATGPNTLVVVLKAPIP